MYLDGIFHSNSTGKIWNGMEWNGIPNGIFHGGMDL